MTRRAVAVRGGVVAEEHLPTHERREGPYLDREDETTACSVENLQKVRPDRSYYSPS